MSTGIIASAGASFLLQDEVEFDSWLTAEDSGVTPPSSQIQWLNTPLKHGVAFEPVAGSITVHGARYWRLAFDPMPACQLQLHIGPPGGTSVRNKLLVSGTVQETGWETVMFDTPVVVSDETIMWISRYDTPSGDSTRIDMARFEPYFPADTPVESRLGLFRTVPPSARFEVPAEGVATDAPVNGHDTTWYYIDPLASA